jgi:hypothetical protein
MESPANTGFWLSPQQRHVWSQQLDGVATRSTCLVLVEGALPIDNLKRALSQLVARHEILRTVYRRQPGMKFPFQVVLESDDPSLEVTDLSGLSESEQKNHLEELFRQEQLRSGGPETGPVLAARFATFGPDRSALILGLPCLSAGLRSLQVLVQELGGFATGNLSNADEEPLRYVQFTQWQNDLVESADETAIKGREFWTNTGYGTPSEGIRASRPKNMLNTRVANRGCRTAHATPSTVCLYLTLMSRHTRKYSSSRYSHRLPSSRSQKAFRGWTMMVARGACSTWINVSDCMKLVHVQCGRIGPSIFYSNSLPTEKPRIRP